MPASDRRATAVASPDLVPSTGRCWGLGVGVDCRSTLDYRQLMFSAMYGGKPNCESGAACFLSFIGSGRFIDGSSNSAEDLQRGRPRGVRHLRPRIRRARLQDEIPGCEMPGVGHAVEGSGTHMLSRRASRSVFDSDTAFLPLACSASVVVAALDAGDGVANGPGGASESLVRGIREQPTFGRRCSVHASGSTTDARRPAPICAGRSLRVRLWFPLPTDIPAVKTNSLTTGTGSPGSRPASPGGTFTNSKTLRQGDKSS